MKTTTSFSAKKNSYAIKILVFLFSIAMLFATSKNAMANCTASFTYTVTGNEVHFTNTSQTDSTAYWSWGFGDGEYSDLKNPVHVYNGYGPYVVCLVVNDTINSCTEYTCDSIYLNNNVGCVANFTYTVDGLTITVTNTSIGTLSTYYWNFGDNTYSFDVNTSHEYSEPGYYEVCFSFIDSINNCSDSECKNIYIGDSNFVSCNAAFTYYADGNNIHFVNTSTTCGNDQTWYWSFGDGGTSTNYDPWHLYSSEGTYEVCLTLTDSSCGCVDYSCETITVGGNNTPCNSEFILVADSTQQGFYWGYNQSTGSNLVYYWWWGDGEYSTDQFPSHTYSDSGYYTICLSIYDTITSCSDSFCNNYYILKQMKIDQMHQIVFVNTTGVPLVTPQTKFEWSIYPNPASNSISIRTNTEKIDEIKIADASGSVVKQIFSYSGKSISIDELPPGIYLIETFISGMKETKMFVKQ